MRGMQVVVVEQDDSGNVDVADLRKAAQYAADLASADDHLPSTHGVFEESIREICAIVHQFGGQVYMDGANLNAQVGLTSRRRSAPTSHMNLHKTFCIPHGGGGPGMGPIGLAAHLAPFMADHVVQPTGGAGRPNLGRGAVSAAPFGSASILPISWMYITMMGGEGLKRGDRGGDPQRQLPRRALGEHYPVLCTRQPGPRRARVHPRHPPDQGGDRHLRGRHRQAPDGLRLPCADHVLPGGGHDRGRAHRVGRPRRASAFCGRDGGDPRGDPPDRGRHLARRDNPLKHAPHTQSDFLGDWNRPIRASRRCSPALGGGEQVLASVNRIDDVGDRNLFCACVPMSDYAE